MLKIIIYNILLLKNINKDKRIWGKVLQNNPKINSSVNGNGILE